MGYPCCFSRVIALRLQCRVSWAPLALAFAICWLTGTPFDSIPIPTRGITHGTVRVKARNQRRKAHNWDKVNKGCQPGPLGHVKGSPQLIRGHWRLQIAVGSPFFSTSVPQNHKPAAIIRTLGGSLERRIQVPSKRHTMCIGGNLDLPGPAGQLKAYR